MARQLKPQKVDFVGDDKTGMRVDIMLDRNENTFFAEVGDQKVTDETAAGCRQKARELLKEMRQFDWKPYIWVKPPEQYEHGGYWGMGSDRHIPKMQVKFEFEFWRAEIAKRPDGKWVERKFLDEKDLSDGDDPRTLSKERLEERAKYNRTARDSGSDISNHWPQHEATYKLVKLEYNPATWAALVAVRERIQQALEQLDEIVNSQDFETRLLAVAKNLKLLPEKT